MSNEQLLSLMAAPEGTTSIPTFLLKLVSLLNEDSNHEYVDWNEQGTSFIVMDQVQFSKIVLPKYFKHNKFASFVRQLNMYGFRKITSLTQSGVNADIEKIEFYHYLFIRGQQSLLEHIKRKVYKPEDPHRRNTEDVNKMLAEVKQMKGHQENVNSRLTELKQENEELWGEIVNLRSKHSHQQRVVNKLIQFLVNLVQQHGMGVKRKLPLMIGDGSSGSREYAPDPKYQKTLFIEEDDQPSKPTVSFPLSIMAPSEAQQAGDDAGPYITDVTNDGVVQQKPSYIDIEDIIPATPAFDVNEYIESHLSPPEVRPQSSSVTFPDEFEEVAQPVPVNQAVSQVQALVGVQQPTKYSQVPANSVTHLRSHEHQPEMTRYESPRSPHMMSSNDMNTHCDLMQNNLENIHDLLFTNDQVKLDYGLIHELFSSSADILPPPPAQPPQASVGPSDKSGDEVVLHSNDNDFGDLSQYLG